MNPQTVVVVLCGVNASFRTVSQIMLVFDVFSFVSLSMGLSACNSSGHLSNHADIAPNHAGVTFAISNTLVCGWSFYIIGCFLIYLKIMMF